MATESRSVVGARRSRLELLVPALLALAIGAVALLHGPRTYDDAFITFRYARNLREGAGLVFNPGERVLGTSAPAFAVLLAGLSFLTGSRDFPLLSFIVSAISLPVIVAGAYALCRRSVSPLLSAAAVAAALTRKDSLEVFASGMETPLYLALLVGALATLATRPLVAFVLAGVLPFVHPESALLYPALFVAFRLSAGRWPWRDALLGAILPLATALLLTISFGSPIPQSVSAKSVLYVRPVGHAFGELAGVLTGTLCPTEAIAHLPLGASTLATVIELLGTLFAVVVLAVLLFGVRRSAGAPAFATAALLFIALVFVAFSLSNPSIFPWYRPPLRLALVLGLVPRFASAALRSSLVVRLGFVWALVVLLGSSASLTTFTPYRGEERELVYRRAMEALDLSPSDLVAAPEIGAVGYYTRARILDTSGLVTPASLRYHDAAWKTRGSGLRGGNVPPRLLGELRPDYVVSLTAFLEPLLEAEPAALRPYERIATYPAGFMGSRLEVYRRTIPVSTRPVPDPSRR